MTLAPQAWPSLDGQIPPDTIGYIWLPFTDFRSDYDYRHRFDIVHSCSGIHWITAVVQEEKKADTYRQVLGILDGFSRFLFRSSLLLSFLKTLSDWSWTAKVLKETLILGILVRIPHDFIKARLMYTKGLVELCGLHVIVACLYSEQSAQSNCTGAELILLESLAILTHSETKVVIHMLAAATLYFTVATSCPTF